MKYAVELASGSKFHKDLFRYSKVDGETHRHTGSIEIAYTHIHFFQNKESRLKIEFSL
jgi:hypothetical protein